jgi:DNA invertase Pin-like site-specific DNA recombinase
VVCLEISRLGRNTLECLQCINILTENSVSLLIVNNGLETLNDKGEVNPVTQLILTIMLELGAMERKLIRERVESGYNHFRKNGGIVGRKQGYKKPIQEMKEQYKEEIKMLEKGYSYQHISQITNTNKNTLTKLKRLFITE